MVNVRDDGNAEFPPSTVDGGSTTGREAGYANWLTTNDTPVRYQTVATLNGRVIGHAAVCDPHDYLAGVGGPSALEVSRLFVDPVAQTSGLGRALLARAVRYVTDTGGVPVLAVLAGSVPAIRLYEQTGWVEVGRFDGVQGENVVMVWGYANRADNTGSHVGTVWV